MATSYTGMGVRPVGTVICDRCGATWSDGLAETETWGQGNLLVRAREKAGWKMYRPNEHRADNLCPNCPGNY